MRLYVMADATGCFLSGAVYGMPGFTSRTPLGVGAIAAAGVLDLGEMTETDGVLLIGGAVVMNGTVVEVGTTKIVGIPAPPLTTSTTSPTTVTLPPPRRRQHSVIAGMIAAGVVIVVCAMVLRAGAKFCFRRNIPNFEKPDDEELIVLDDDDTVSTASSRTTWVIRL